MKRLIFILGFLFSVQLHASGVTAVGEISNIYVNNSWTMVHLPTVSDNPDNCSSTGYYAIVPSDSNYEALHSTLLAAHFANKRVKFWVNGCGGQNGSHPKITSVWVYK